MNTNWYCVKTDVRREGVAESSLSSYGIKVLAPRIRAFQRNPYRPDKPHEITLPLFPGYIFAALNLEEHYYRMRRANGVRHLVGFENCPSVVDPWVIDEIQSRIVDGFVKLSEKPVEPFESLSAGETVRVVEGCFAGQLATFHSVFKLSSDGNHRVIVLMNLLNGARAQLDRSQIELLSYAEAI